VSLDFRLASAEPEGSTLEQLQRSALEQTARSTFDQLYTRHGLSLYALAYGIVIDPLEAEEAVRESVAEFPRHVAGGVRRSAYDWLAARVRSRALGAVRARAWPARSRETPISSDTMEAL
jgi:DNA-directed RNA polymerase specialized sigma24 family protein